MLALFALRRFLKKKFGLGYILNTIKHDAHVDTKQALDFIQERAPSASLIRDVGKELTLKIGLNDVSHFPALLSDLDAHKEDLLLDGYGLSMTTLEEVFLKLADEELEDSAGDGNSDGDGDGDGDNGTAPGSDANGMPASAGAVDTTSDSSLDRPPSFLVKLWALVTTTWREIRRNKAALFFLFIFPNIIVVVLFTVLTPSTSMGNSGTASSSNPAALEVSLSSAYPGMTADLPFGCDEDTDGTCLAVWLPKFVNGSADAQHVSFLQTDFAASNGSEWQRLLLANSSRVVAGGFSLVGVGTGSAPIETTILYNQTTTHALPALVSWWWNATSPAASRSFRTFSQKLPSPVTGSGSFDIQGMLLIVFIGMFLIMPAAGLIKFVIEERVNKTKHLINTAGTGPLLYYSSKIVALGLPLSLPSLFVFIVCQVHGNEIFTGPAVGPMFGLFLFNTPMILLFIFALGFLFDDSALAQSISQNTMSTVAYVPILAVLIMDMAGSCETKQKVSLISCALALFIPPSTLGVGLAQLFRIYFYSVLTGSNPGDLAYWSITGHEFAFLVGDGSGGQYTEAWGCDVPAYAVHGLNRLTWYP